MGGVPCLCDIRKESAVRATLSIYLRRAIDMVLERDTARRDLGSKGVQKGDKEIRSITDSR